MKKGREQADELDRFFSRLEVDGILSSPYKRAVQSIMPLAKRLHLKVTTDERLAERKLSARPIADWREKLKQTFSQLDVCFEGGESSRTAMNRAQAVLKDLALAGDKNIIVVTHGNLLVLLLKLFDPRFGFEQWHRLTNPDVFLLKMDNAADKRIRRLWS